MRLPQDPMSHLARHDWRGYLLGSPRFVSESRLQGVGSVSTSSPSLRIGRSSWRQIVQDLIIPGAMLLRDCDDARGDRGLGLTPL